MWWREIRFPIRGGIVGFNEEYDLKGLNLNTLIALYNKISNNETILNKFYKHINPGSNVSHCDNNCKNGLLNDIFPKT